jgi:hypothetical protein
MAMVGSIHLCIRVKTPPSLEDARRPVAKFVVHDNEVRLHSAIGSLAPADKVAGRARIIVDDRDRKLGAARAEESRPSGQQDDHALRGHCPGHQRALR